MTLMQNLYIFQSNGGPVCSTNMKAILTSAWSSRSLDQFLLYMCDDSTAIRRTCMKHVGKWGYDAQKISLLESVCYRFFQVIHVHTHTHCPVIYQTSVHISHIFLTVTGIPVLECCDVTAVAWNKNYTQVKRCLGRTCWHLLSLKLLTLCGEGNKNYKLRLVEFNKFKFVHNLH